MMKEASIYKGEKTIFSKNHVGKDGKLHLKMKLEHSLTPNKQTKI